MCTAEDFNIGIYYQDTDYIFLDADRIDDIANEFRIRYGRELIYIHIGQFHNDIDEVSDVYMNELIVVWKNATMLRLQMMLDTLLTLQNEIYKSEISNFKSH